VTNSSPFTRRSSALPTVPRGDVLGEYESYVEAQKVIDRLAKADFAITGLAIVGSDLKTVEVVTGRLSYGRAAFAGAASGSWLGLFFGLLIFVFSTVPEFSYVVAAALIGAGLGMIFGIISYSIGRRRRDFSSTHQVLASTYQIIIDPNQTARARQALAGGSAWPPPLPPTATTASADGEPADADSVSAEPAGTKPADAEPADAEPADAEPAETEPAAKS
jgi:hypothetical protein